MTDQTQRAIRYFCYTAGTVALLGLAAALVLAIAFGRAVTTGSSNVDPLTTQSTLAPNGVCSADQVDVDPDC